MTAIVPPLLRPWIRMGDSGQDTTDFPEEGFGDRLRNPRIARKEIWPGSLNSGVA
jgi:hypothetical protein